MKKVYTQDLVLKSLERAEKYAIKSKVKDTKETAKIKLDYIMGKITLTERNILLGEEVVIGTGSTKEVNTINYKSAKLFSRVDTEWSDSERLENGLVAPKIAKETYLLQPDNTKVCRCCSNKKDKTCFSNLKKSKDGLCNICRDCDARRGATWRASKESSSN